MWSSEFYSEMDKSKRSSSWTTKRKRVIAISHLNLDCTVQEYAQCVALSLQSELCWVQLFLLKYMLDGFSCGHNTATVSAVMITGIKHTAIAWFFLLSWRTKIHFLNQHISKAKRCCLIISKQFSQIVIRKKTCVRLYIIHFLPWRFSIFAILHSLLDSCNMQNKHLLL